LASLIEVIPSVSNTTGTYGAYLKQWDKRSFKELELPRLEVIDNGRHNKAYNEDALKLIGSIEGNIIYIDPPYNERQYAPNYHILETISKYDYPEIKGITGMRAYQDQKSPFCVKSEVNEAFEELISKAKFENIVMSYSSDGLMKDVWIEKILKKYGISESFRKYIIPYRKYKSKRDNAEHTLYEFLFYIKKPIKHIEYFCDGCAKPTATSSKSRTVEKKKYIKSPTNYIGGKYKILSQILPYFPRDIHTFVDLFAGGCNVAVNMWADKIYCNDINKIIIDLFSYFNKTPIDALLIEIQSVINEFQLSKTNEAGFKALRDRYNAQKNFVDLYVLSCYSFNYQFRFNNNLEYNNPFGRNRSQFSESMKNNLIRFTNQLHNMDVTFTSNDFREFSIEGLNGGDLIYCDPPYLITTGSYNDGNRGFKSWGIEEEMALYKYLDRVNEKGIRFALSNVMEHKGKLNDILIEWSKNYRVIKIDNNYANSSYNTVRGSSKEVLILNY
jgi:adenine-specific DNA-methyltransferase